MFALEDIAVVGLESGVSGTLCTRLLGDQGADVVKVERPGTGDVARHWDSAVHGNSSAHVWVNRNKRSVELDLTEQSGHEAFERLAAKADVVVQNFAPSVVEDLGVAYDDVNEYNEDVVYLNISGYGRTGPYSERKAYDLVMQGETGMISLTGHSDAPAKIPISTCDITAANGAMGILTALFHRARTGEGTEIDVSMFEGMLSMLGYFPLKYWYDDEVPERTGMRHHLLTPYGPHETSDGQWLNFAVLSEAHWRQFCEDVIERPDLATDPRFETNEKRMANREVFEPIVEECIAGETREYWIELLDAAGIPRGDVNDLEDVLEHSQTDHLNAIRQLATDAGQIRFVDNPLYMDGLEAKREPMPDLGADTEAVLRELGYEGDELQQIVDGYPE
jgi:crotonobetainyl-CoA:carnitine CoA-transferase CaiB-like acyl-CoA transferase